MDHSDLFVAIEATALLSVALVYFAAAAAERETKRMYVGLGISWLINASYLISESLLVLGDSQGTAPSPACLLDEWLVPARIGLISTFVIHYCFATAEGRSLRRLSGVVVPTAVSGAILCLPKLGNLMPSLPDILSAQRLFSLLVLPQCIYSGLVLLNVARWFAGESQDEDYGWAGRALCGSWAMYGMLQLLYPFRCLPEAGKLVAVLFVGAFFLKVLGGAALGRVNALKLRTASAMTTQATVLQDMGSIAAGLYHDIGGPLASMSGDLGELVQKRNQDPIVMEFVGKLQSQLSRIEATRELVGVLRKGEVHDVSRRSDASLGAALDRAKDNLRARYGQTEMRVLVVGRSGSMFVRVQSDHLAEVFFNILTNAHEARARRVRISAWRNDEDNQRRVMVHIANDGAALTEEQQQRYAEAGYSSKKEVEHRESRSRANRGMGLYMVRRIVEMYQGKLSLVNLHGDDEGYAVEAVLDLPRGRR